MAHLFSQQHDQNIQGQLFSKPSPNPESRLFYDLNVLTVSADNNEETTGMLRTCSIWYLSHTQLQWKIPVNQSIHLLISVGDSPVLDEP